VPGLLVHACARGLDCASFRAAVLHEDNVTRHLCVQSTCGTSEMVGYLIFTLFLCCSNFILLNLVMAVLMQELQSAIQSSEKKAKSGLGMLMSVSAATSKWYADSNCRPTRARKNTQRFSCALACA
jgi:hypothetical protein